MWRRVKFVEKEPGFDLMIVLPDAVPGPGARLRTHGG